MRLQAAARRLVCRLRSNRVADQPRDKIVSTVRSEHNNEDSKAS